MQTFLPYEDFNQIAQVLDMKRLGKQRVECLQILNTLHNGSRWQNHPAVLMWQGHALYLQKYSIAICERWISLGYEDTCLDRSEQIDVQQFINETFMPPHWLGDDKFHSSHRAALLFKKFEHYSQFGWTEEPMMKYYWPVSREG